MLNQIKCHLRKRGFSDVKDWSDQIWARPDSAITFLTTKYSDSLTVKVGEGVVARFDFWLEKGEGMTRPPEWMVDAVWGLPKAGSIGGMRGDSRCSCKTTDVTQLIDAIADPGQAAVLAGFPWASAVMEEILK